MDASRACGAGARAGHIRNEGASVTRRRPALTAGRDETGPGVRERRTAATGGAMDTTRGRRDAPGAVALGHRFK